MGGQQGLASAGERGRTERLQLACPPGAGAGAGAGAALVERRPGSKATLGSAPVPAALPTSPAPPPARTRLAVVPCFWLQYRGALVGHALVGVAAALQARGGGAARKGVREQALWPARARAPPAPCCAAAPLANPPGCARPLAHPPTRPTTTTSPVPATSCRGQALHAPRPGPRPSRLDVGHHQALGARFAQYLAEHLDALAAGQQVGHGHARHARHLNVVVPGRERMCVGGGGGGGGGAIMCMRMRV